MNPTSPKPKTARISVREVRAQVWDASAGHCYYCGMSMNPFRNFSIDHKVPVSLGGTNHPNNLVACCLTCNQSKGKRTDDDFIRRSRLVQSQDAAERRELERMSVALDDVVKQLSMNMASIESALIYLDIIPVRLTPGGKPRIWRLHFHELKSFILDDLPR